MKNRYYLYILIFLILIIGNIFIFIIFQKNQEGKFLEILKKFNFYQKLITGKIISKDKKVVFDINSFIIDFNNFKIKMIPKNNFYNFKDLKLLKIKNTYYFYIKSNTPKEDLVLYTNKWIKYQEDSDEITKILKQIFDIKNYQINIKGSFIELIPNKKFILKQPLSKIHINKVLLEVKKNKIVSAKIMFKYEKNIYNMDILINKIPSQTKFLVPKDYINWNDIVKFKNLLFE